jgi:hypothetical protein
MGASSPPVIPKPTPPKENDATIQAALEKEKLMRQRRVGRASTILSGESQTKTKLGE